MKDLCSKGRAKGRLRLTELAGAAVRSDSDAEVFVGAPMVAESSDSGDGNFEYRMEHTFQFPRPNVWAGYSGCVKVRAHPVF